jgi:RNA polymerase sigma-70 factor (ECF subfamily)
MFELPAEQSPRAIIVAMTRMPAAPEKDLDAANAASAGAGQDGEPSTRDAVADEQLMLAYAAGDVAAFERLYDRHEGPVYRFLLRSIGVPGVAEELLQEVWLAVVRNAASYQPQALFRTWLYRIARSRLIDHWRALPPVTLVSLDEDRDGDRADPSDARLVDAIAGDAALQPEVQAMGRSQARALVAAVEALPAAQREVFLMHADGDLTLEQIAMVIGIGVETAKSRLRYALGKLRVVRQAWS